jgi:hypothetical protein
MPKLPAEPRLQLSEGCRAFGGGAIRQKDFLGFLTVWTDAHVIDPLTQELHRYDQPCPSTWWRGFLSGGRGIQYRWE